LETFWYIVSGPCSLYGTDRSEHKRGPPAGLVQC